MYGKVLIGGVTAAVIVGAGGTAMALTGSDAPSPSGTSANSTTSSSAPAAPHAKARARLLHRMSHAQIVTRGKDGFVTHDLIRGTVTSVSSTSITVQAADKTVETFIVNADTKVRVRSNGKGAPSTISAVHSGDHVLVAGTGTTTLTAKHIRDVKK